MTRADPRRGTPVRIGEDTPMPPSDAPAGGDRERSRRAEVDALVIRTLPPALGLCVRVFDPFGDNPEGRDKARMVAMDSIARCAASGASDDDAGIRKVMGTVAEAGLDALVGHPGSAPVPAGLNASIPVERPAGGVHGGQLQFALLQDATAAARRSDRRVAFIVLAAGIPASDTAVILGVDQAKVDASLQRIAHRISEMQGDGPVAESDESDLVETIP